MGVNVVTIKSVILLENFLNKAVMKPRQLGFWLIIAEARDKSLVISYDSCYKKWPCAGL
jgi:hypothetical protein